jgi:hypothetical protein
MFPGRAKLLTRPKATGSRIAIMLLSDSADAQPDIDLLLKQTQHAIGEDQTNLDIAIGLEEIRQDRDEVNAPRPTGAVTISSPVGAVYSPEAGALGFRNIRENALARGDILHR